MTPGARLQAAAEILDILAREARGTDRVLRDYFRRRRYAGSKDRRAVGARVYGVLRRTGAALWALQSAGPADPGPRLVLIADLMLADGLSLAEIDGLFDGSGHGPAPLSGAERAAAEALAAQAAAEALADRAGAGDPAPAWAAGNLPAWLEAPLRARFGTDLDDELAALNAPAPVDLRVNPLRVEGPSKDARARARADLAAAGIAAAPTPLAPLGLRLDAPADLTRTGPWKAGAVEIQDEGSQLVARLVDARPGMTVIDYCAGAGGKALALAADMAGRGRLIACDSAPDRLARLEPRADRAGAGFVERRPLAGDDPLADLTGAADRVLLDVPCTGMGAWRRDPAARWRLRPADLERRTAEQAAILAAAAPLVRPGGRLIYATCAFLAAENEAQVARFLEAQPDFRLLPAAEAAAADLPAAALSADGAYLSVTPGRQGCEGFFAAVLERAETDAAASEPAFPGS